MDVSVSSRAQSSATSSSSSVLPSDSASQFASTLSEPEASSTEHTVKRRKLRAIATWDHFRGAQGDEPRAISGNLLHYCKRCRNPSWSTHISSNARYHLKKAHHIFVREDSSSQNKRQLAIENAFARTTARQLQQVREHERNTLRSVINVDAFREAQMLLSAHRHLPLNFVTWPEYQALLTAVNPAVQEFLTDSGNTVAADLDRAYDAHQQSVKKWLEHARSLVHIAMDATLEQQMEWASIDQVLENMDILFLQFENAKVKYVNNARMVNSVHMGWWVLSKYYEESDKNPIYATALLLHPEKRRRYLDRHWAEEWRQTAIAGARRHWAKYKDRPLSSDSAARLSNERREVTPYERIKQSMSVLDEPGDEDEFEKF
ncbi:hypothetical protein RAB80_014679, partial [Fusarium oxysporum f. sp. vasinfectum]